MERKIGWGLGLLVAAILLAIALSQGEGWGILLFGAALMIAMFSMAPSWLPEDLRKEWDNSGARIMFGACCVIGIMLTDLKEEPDDPAVRRAELKTEYPQSKASIHRMIREYIWQQNYKTALDQAAPYKVFGDAELLSLIAWAERGRDGVLTREDKIAGQFSPLNGRNIVVSYAVRKFMNDPGSFEHVRTSWQDKGERVAVEMWYRGSNAFGAKVVNAVRAEVSIDGALLNIEAVETD